MQHILFFIELFLGNLIVVFYPTYRDYRIKDHVIKILDVSDVSLYVTAHTISKIIL